jgi:hypothetical protein
MSQTLNVPLNFSKGSLVKGLAGMHGLLPNVPVQRRHAAPAAHSR